jgi:hypothetical protein
MFDESIQIPCYDFRIKTNSFIETQNNDTRCCSICENNTTTIDAGSGYDITYGQLEQQLQNIRQYWQILRHGH